MEQTASLMVDNGSVMTGTAPGSLSQLNANNGLFVGKESDNVQCFILRTSWNLYTFLNPFLQTFILCGPFKKLRINLYHLRIYLFVLWIIHKFVLTRVE